MKSFLVCILIISFLLESCHSYKTIAINKTPLAEGKKYKYNTAQNKKYEKFTLKSFNDSIMNAKIGSKEKQITIIDITSIKVRKFSVVKTIALTLITIVILAIGSFLIAPKINAPIGN